MNSCSDENDRFFESIGSTLFREEIRVEEFFVFLFFIVLIVWGDSEKVYISLIWTFDEYFFMKIELIVGIVLI